MFELEFQTPNEWTEAVLADFDTFLQDHAAAEKKASAMALSMLSHYRDKRKLVKAMTDLALEEMIHFKQVVKLLTERDVNLSDNKKDPYVNQLHSMFRHGKQVFMLDKLLVAAVIE
ncbi:MAG: tRNA isopentenyl-2-thiomethyl-A-37 hydroxylase MiaE, partial [Exilibacterium sp.]